MAVAVFITTSLQVAIVCSCVHLGIVETLQHVHMARVYLGDTEAPVPLAAIMLRLAAGSDLLPQTSIITRTHQAFIPQQVSRHKASGGSRYLGVIMEAGTCACVPHMRCHSVMSVAASCQLPAARRSEQSQKQLTTWASQGSRPRPPCHQLSHLESIPEFQYTAELVVYSS